MVTLNLQSIGRLVWLISLASFALVVSATITHAANVKFCFRTYSDVADASVGRYFNGGIRGERLRGGKVRIVWSRPGSRVGVEGTVFDGYVSDSGGDPGCTGSFVVPEGGAYYYIHAYAEVRVGSVTVSASNKTPSSYSASTYPNDGSRQLRTTEERPGFASATWVPDPPVSGTVEFWIDPPNQQLMDIFRSLNVIAFGLFRYSAGISSPTTLSYNYSQRFGTDNILGCSANRNGINMDSGCTRRKFLAIHELGHAIFALADIKVSAGSYTSFYAGDGTSQCTHELGPEPGAPYNYHYNECRASANNHSLASKESNEAALKDGAAHFYSALVFNDARSHECQFAYYKRELRTVTPDDVTDDNVFPIISCYSGDLSVAPTTSYTHNNHFPNNFAGTRCAMGWNGGRGTEMDWLRALWTLKTGGHRLRQPLDIHAMTRFLKSIRPSTYEYDADQRVSQAARATGGRVLINWTEALRLQELR